MPDLLLAPVGGGAPFISPDLGAAVQPVVKSGYTIAMAIGVPGAADPADRDSCNTVVAADLINNYTATGEPTSPNGTGTRFFYTNTLGTIFQNTAAIAQADGFLAPAAPAVPIG
jgi:hypothetical protein